MAEIYSTENTMSLDRTHKLYIDDSSDTIYTKGGGV